MTAPDAPDPVTLPTIAFLGVGSMAGAILRGLLSPGVKVVGGIRTTNRDPAKAAALAELPGVTAYSTGEDADANRTAVAGARVVVVAVKPAMVPDLLAEIAGALAPDAVVVSVAAGVTVASMEAVVPGVSIVRAMPNTPAKIGRGVTGLSAGTRSSDDDLDLVGAVFGTVGDVVVVPESQLDALTAISGSGPAYVFYLIEQLTHSAIDKGFTPEQADLLVGATFRGASELVMVSEQAPAELRRQVTSPNGTTEAALRVLQAGGLKELFDAATDAAVARAEELARG